VAISVEGFGATQYTNTRSPSITFGVSPIENDVLFVSVGAVGNETLTNEPTGWVNVLADGTYLDPGDATCKSVHMYHIVTAAEDSANTVTWTLTNTWNGATADGETVGVILRGVDTAAVVDASNSAVNAGTVTPHTLPSITGTDIGTTGGLVVSTVVKDGLGTYTTPGTHTVITESTATNQGVWLGYHNTLVTASTNVTAVNITPSASDEYMSVSVVFTPAAGGGGTATPAAISVAVTIPQTTPLAGSVVTPAATSVAVALPQAQGRGSQTVIPAATTVAVTMGQATPLASSTVTPAAISVPVTIPQATPLASSTVTPAATTVTVTIPQATPLAGATVTPDAIPLTVTIPAVTATGAGGGTAAPASITTVVTVPQATPLAGSVVTPAATSRAVTMPQATAQASHTATPAVIPITIAIPQATASGVTGGTASPNAIALVTVVPSPTLVYGSTVNPAAIQLAISIGAAIAAGLVPDAHPVTVTLRDEGHTITVRVVGTTATVRTAGSTTTKRENR
jgi:hypothetical protein